ncbi:hypothetical protein [Georgenia subflava]|uniref:Uncharacterized protein n=1 Tax=Georgenia subflava TaxID=1622177 RepID=A0A6N7EMM5_9MICO|nr:hypothetical protein [Georgenia subflava]MPV37396.1 hypothetical protein [Georgenia subflava]
MSTPSPDHRAESETPGSEPTGPASAGRIDHDATTGDATAGQAAPARADVSPGSDAPARTDAESETETTAVRRRGFLGLHGDDAAAAPSTGVADAPSTGAAETRRLSPSRGSSAVTPDRAGDDAALRERWRDQPEPTTDVLLDGATQAAPRSRAGAHVLALVLSILLVPIAWYLVADAGARLTLGEDSPWETGDLNPAALIELVAALVVVAAVLLLARWSSVGAIVTGVVVLLAGLAFVVVPGLTREVLEPALEWLRGFNDLGGNVAHHLTADGPAGRIALYGLALILVGVVSHGARRLGRSEERSREARARREERAGRHGTPRA